MSFLRPEAKQSLVQWREALVGVAIWALGLFWVFSSGGILRWIGIAVALGGAILIYTGLQRARFQPDSGGPGVVTVDERQISYYGPLSGGVVSLNDLSMLMLDPTAKPPVWRLHQPSQPDIAIPLNAEGAEGLFDVFASLPNMRTEFMLSQLKGKPSQPVVIWSKPATTLH